MGKHLSVATRLSEFPADFAPLAAGGCTAAAETGSAVRGTGRTARPWRALYGPVPATIVPTTQDRPRHVPRHGPAQPARAAGALLRPDADRRTKSIACRTAWPSGCSGAASCPATASRCTCRTSRRSSSRCSRPGSAAPTIVPCNPMLKERELEQDPRDSGSRVLVCQEELYADVAEATIPETDVALVVTTSALDFLPPDSGAPGWLTGMPRLRHLGALDLLELAMAYSGEQPVTMPIDEQRHRVHGLHVRHDGRSEGRDEHARQRGVRHHRLRAVDRPDRHRHDPGARAALPRDGPRRPRDAGHADGQPPGALLSLRRRKKPAG